MKKRTIRIRKTENPGPEPPKAPEPSPGPVPVPSPVPSPSLVDFNSYDFILNVDSSLANSLRRILIGQIPSVAIDTVKIEENDSQLCDEMIAQRLGLIPLRVTSVNNESSQSVNEYTVKLDQIGPKRIYSGDLIFSPGIEPVNPDIILLNLGPGEQLRFSGETEIGIGKQHAKFSVCCGTSYKKLSDTSFQFHVETTGTITGKEAFVTAVDILKRELNVYRKLLNSGGQ